MAYTGSSYDGTACRLRAFDRSFNESQISLQASAPITPGVWFQLSGVFPSTSVEQQINELVVVECNLPGDWTYGDPSDAWWVDDIQVN